MTLVVYSKVVFEALVVAAVVFMVMMTVPRSRFVLKDRLSPHPTPNRTNVTDPFKQVKRNIWNFVFGSMKYKVNSSDLESSLKLLLKDNYLDSWKSLFNDLRNFPVFVANNGSLSFPNPISQYKSCAVVSSGPEVSHYEHGPHIDQNEAIFRINKAVTEKFEKIAGSRTDYRLVNNQARAELSKSNNVSYISKDEVLFTYLTCDHFHGPIEKCWNNLDNFVKTSPFDYRYGSKRIHVIPGTISKLLMEFLDSVTVHNKYGKNPTSGLLAIVVAMLHCDVVYAYGFLPLHVEEKCYYYSGEDPCGQNIGYHPRHIEKTLLLAIGEPDEELTYGRGVVKLIKPR